MVDAAVQALVFEKRYLYLITVKFSGYFSSRIPQIIPSILLDVDKAYTTSHIAVVQPKIGRFCRKVFKIA